MVTQTATRSRKDVRKKCGVALNILLVSTAHFERGETETAYTRKGVRKKCGIALNIFARPPLRVLSERRVSQLTNVKVSGNSD